MSMRVLRRRVRPPVRRCGLIDEWQSVAVYFGQIRPHFEDAMDFGGWYDYYQLFGGGLDPTDPLAGSGEIWLTSRTPGDAAHFAAYRPYVGAVYEFDIAITIDADTLSSTTPYARSGDFWRLVALVGTADDELYSYLGDPGPFSPPSPGLRYYDACEAATAITTWTDADAVNPSGNPVWQINTSHTATLTADEIISFFFLWTGPVPIVDGNRDFDRTMSATATINISIVCE